MITEAECDARVAAARAETAEQIAQAIEAKGDWLMNNRGNGYAYTFWARLARSVPGTTEGGSK